MKHIMLVNAVHKEQMRMATIDEKGTLTELAIARPEAFQLLEGMGQSKLFGKLNTKEQRDKKEKYSDWSVL